MIPTLKLEFDCPEPRTLYDRLVVSADGTTFNTRTPDGSDLDDKCYLDPITNTVMLRPLPFTTAWANTTTGNYARLRKTDYTLITSSAWVEHPVTSAGDYYLESLGVNEIVYTTATYPRNRPFWVSTYVYGVSTQRAIIMECGWGSPSTGVSLRISADGVCEVWKGTEYLAQYDLGTYTDIGANNKVQTGKKALAGNFVNLCLIPCRARDLLVLCDAGGGFCHTFADLAADNTVQDITPASAPFWWKVPSGKASVQVQPLGFESVGVAYGDFTLLPYAPSTGRTFTAIDARHGAGYGTQSASFSLIDGDIAGLATDFVANGAKRNTIIRATLGGDGTSTPFLYAVDFVAERVATTTADEPFDMSEFITSLTWDVPEEGATTLKFTADDIDKLETAGLNRPGLLGDRPVRLSVTSDIGDEETPELVEVDFFRGTAARPDIERGTGIDHNTKDALTWIATDRDKQFELCRFRNTLPYDGYTLNAATLDLVKLPGFAVDDLEQTTDTFPLPYSPAVSKGDWKVLPERGDAVNDWLDKLHKDYCATWLTGWGPTNIPGRDTPIKYRYRRIRPDELPVTPDMTVYMDVEDAITDGLSREVAIRQLVYAITEQPEEPEANQVVVVGWDPGAKRYLTDQYDDVASQTPGTAVASRPENWRGQLVSVQYLDDDLTTQDAVERTTDILEERLTVSRIPVILTCPMLIKPDGVPIWRGDLLEVKNQGGGVYGNFRVLSLSGESIQEEVGFQVREVSYTTRLVL